MRDPLFNGQTVDKFYAIIQGHIHWKMYESSPSTEFYSIRAVGMAYKEDPVDTASYAIVNATTGFQLEEILVRYDREKTLASILNCTMTERGKILNFISLTKEEKRKLQ